MIEFLPRGACQGWTPGMLVAIDVADAVVFLAYMMLPILAVYVYRLVLQKGFQLPMSLMLWSAGFVFFCGLSHATDVAMTWWPEWRIDVAAHACTAVVSVCSAFCAATALVKEKLI